MKTFTSETIYEFAEPLGLAVDTSFDWHRRPLKRCKPFAQNRVTSHPVISLVETPTLAGRLVSWLPPASRILLWVDHLESLFPSCFPALRGLGITLSEKNDERGFLYGPLGADLWDEFGPQAKEFDLLVAQISVLMMNGCDGKLISDGTADWIEFWEGNLLFYSNDNAKLKAAQDIIDFFNLPSEMK